MHVLVPAIPRSHMIAKWDRIVVNAIIHQLLHTLSKDNLEKKSKDFLAKLLGATFQEANWTGEQLGIDVAISWDAGIELCAPQKGREKDSAITPFLEENGEGIVNVVFGFSDAIAALNNAENIGLSAFHSVDYTQQEIDDHLDGLFTRYKEYFIDTTEQCGFTTTLAQIESKARKGIWRPMSFGSNRGLNYRGIFF